MSTHKIICPHCSHEFDVESVISGRLEARFKAEFAQKTAEQNQRLSARQAELEHARAQLDQEQAAYDERLQAETDKALKSALKSELTKAQQAIKEAVAEDFEVKLVALQAENDQRKAENRTLKQNELALMQREAALKEKQEELTLQMEKTLLERQSEIVEQARAKERDAFELEKRQLLKKIEENKRLAEEMRRKAEQGSIQLQGEMQELALEARLTAAYPFDEVAPVPKGMRGADCVQNVRNAAQQICGKIVYESKRTKTFSNDWIEKLKNDQVTCKADFAVLVTQTLPDGIAQFGERNGVWICDFSAVKSLSFILRDMLFRLHTVRQSQENKGEKKDMLYHYLTSHEFVQHVQRVVDVYDQMQKQIHDERKAMEKQWKRREKMVEIVQLNLQGMFGSIEGYTGKTLTEDELFGLSDE